MCRIHALVISVSGATNIIPDKAVCRVEARATCRTTLNEMMDAVFCCARGAAVATRTNVSWSKFMRSFDDMLPNLEAEKLAEDVLLKYGVVCTHNHCPAGSTDVGNVSYRCPAIQPEYAITKRNLSLHTREFAAATISDEGHEALLTSIMALSEICLKVLTDDILRKEIKSEFLGRREKS
jgi:metal-dependent amidase/aminoacylase/carboxypeptidase family protein